MSHEKIHSNLMKASFASFMTCNLINGYCLLDNQQKRIIAFYTTAILGGIGTTLFCSAILIKKFGLHCFKDNEKEEIEMEYLDNKSDAILKV